jgi:uncharacterized membrane protein YedE/YeeE
MEPVNNLFPTPTRFSYSMPVSPGARRVSLSRTSATIVGNPDKWILGKGPALFGLPPERGRWVFVLIGLVINLCLGSIYAWSVFVEPLTAHFSGLGQVVTANDVLLPFSVYLIVLALTMPFTGRIIDVLGPRNATIAGGVLVGLGWILASLASSVTMISIM